MMISTSSSPWPQAPEKQGQLLNEYSGQQELVILRRGSLRLRELPTKGSSGAELASVYLAHGTGVTLRSDGAIEITAKIPERREYVLVATSNSEAESWHNAIRAALRTEEVKMNALRQMMDEGATMHKYNYSNSKRSRRFFWIGDNGRQLCWGRSKGEDTQSVNLQECIGITYGPVTTTFIRCSNLEDPPWTCFSLLFMGRTLDLTVPNDPAVQHWFLGLQHLVATQGIGSMPPISESRFLWLKAQLKLQGAAHKHNLVMGRYLVVQVKALASGGKGALSPSGPFNPTDRSKNGKEATAADAVASTGSGAKKSSGGGSGKKRSTASTAAPSPDAASSVGAAAAGCAFGGAGEGKKKVTKLLQSLAANVADLEAANSTLEKSPGFTSSGLLDTFKAITSDLRSISESLTKEASNISDNGDGNPSRASSVPPEKLEKALQKLQKKYEDAESRRATLEQEVSSLRGSPMSSTSRPSASDAEDSKRCKALEQKVKELEQQLQQVQVGELAAAKQQLEAKGKELEKSKQNEAQLKKDLLLSKEGFRKLQPQAKALQSALLMLKAGHNQARSETLTLRKDVDRDFVQIFDANTKVIARFKTMEEKYKALIEERKKLHNTILDLKGNIRVFVRVRPINSAEAPSEPEGEATVSFKDDQNLGIFDQGYSRRKWFEFDQVFDMKTTQAKVFQEAQPLATSVLDGYNVCIFAYGQTGSGKTHTMTGTAKDPGLNTNVLQELFRIRDERRGEYDINISISVTEIYNETIRDLLNAGNKKLDVKMNQDGTSVIPGLEERPVETVDAVMKCIADASKNRATSTTDMNEQSSRSHSIVTVRTQSTLRGSTTYVGKIHLIDLAGSENTNKSGVTGQGMKEAQNINKSLSALGDVIQSLVKKDPHTPYRNSKLTMMLKDSLGGDSKTLMIVCTSPAQANVTETLSSLNFAARARNVELGKAKRNSMAAPA